MNKHIAKFKGTTFTRNSKERTYTHVIVVRDSYEYALEQAKKKVVTTVKTTSSTPSQTILRLQV